MQERGNDVEIEFSEEKKFISLKIKQKFVQS